MAIVWFLLGTVTGGFVAMVTLALIQMGKSADSEENLNRTPNKDGKDNI